MTRTALAKSPIDVVEESLRSGPYNLRLLNGITLPRDDTNLATVVVGVKEVKLLQNVLHLGLLPTSGPLWPLNAHHSAVLFDELHRRMGRGQDPPRLRQADLMFFPRFLTKF